MTIALENLITTLREPETEIKGPDIQDMREWMEKNLCIQSKELGYVPMRFEGHGPSSGVSWDYQGELLDEFFKKYKARYFKRFKLKGRQCGSTTLWMAVGLGLSHENPGYHGLILFQDEDTKKKRKADTFDVLYESIPDNVRKECIINNPDQVKFSNGSIIRFAFAPPKQQIARGAGRGDTYQYIIGTEVSFWPYFRKVWAAYASSLVAHGWVVLETTPHPVGRVQVRAMFESAKYRKPGMEDWDVIFLGRDELYGRTEAGRIYLGKMLAELGQEEFDQEYPKTSTDCWGSVGGEFFDYNVVSRIGMLAKAIPFTVGHIDLSTESVVPHPHGEFKVLPGGDPKREAYGDEKDHRYVVGADIGYGVGADWSVAYVKDYDTRETVAQFRSNKIIPVDFADCLILIGEWYNNALLATEVNKKNLGGVVVDRLREREYRRIYTRKKWEEKTRLLEKQYGWLTDGKSRPRMLGHLQHMVNDFTEYKREGVIIPLSAVGNEFPEFWAEAETFRVVDGRAEAEEDRHDDCIITEGIASYVCATYRWHGPALKPKKITYSHNDPRRYFEKAGVSKEALRRLA